MTKESNYFEDAYELCKSDNQFVSKTANVLFEKMYWLTRHESRIPKGDFNILFFIQSVVDLLSREYVEQSRPVEIKEPAVATWISTIRVPESIEQWAGCYIAKTGLLAKYLNSLLEQSSEKGDTFDVTYAISVVASALDKETIDKITKVSDEVVNCSDDSVDFDSVEFDYWLSGFIKPTQE